MPSFKRIATVLPKGDFNYNMLPGFLAELGAAFATRGLEHLAIDSAKPGFQRELLKAAADDDTALYVSHFFYDLGLSYADDSGRQQLSFFEALNRPVFARIADHPFAIFMLDRMAQASRTTHFLVPTMEFAAEAQFVNPTLRHFHQVTPSVTVALPEEVEVLPLEDRPIDVFMPCAFKETSPTIEEVRQHYMNHDNVMLHVIDDTLASCLEQGGGASLAVFQEAVHRRFGGRFKPNWPLSTGDRQILHVLSCIDFEIRTRRRRNAVESLGRLDPALHIVVTIPEEMRDSIPALRDRPNIELIGKVDNARTRELYLSSRFVVNVNPTYTSLFSERVRNAMAFGCCVISDRIEPGAEAFAEGREILLMQATEVAGLDDYLRGDLAQAQSIASAARRRVLADFTVDRLADDIIRVMEEVLAGRGGGPRG